MTAIEIKKKYGLPSYRSWAQIPVHLHTRTSAVRTGAVIPADAKPDAIKNGASVHDKDKVYFLYDITKYKK